MPRPRIEPPSDWRPGLYNFTRNMPLEGWIWEFMRRARLKEILGNRPVDAMNVGLNRHERTGIKSTDWAYFKSWADTSWFDNAGKRKRSPIFLPPAVFRPRDFPTRFSGQPYRPPHRVKNVIDVRVDLNRDTKVIKRDFARLLEQMKSPDSPRGSDNASTDKPKYREWSNMHILEVWDLRQFNVSWIIIATRLGFTHVESILSPARSALRSATKYIDQGEWIDLVYDKVPVY